MDNASTGRTTHKASGKMKDPGKIFEASTPDLQCLPVSRRSAVQLQAGGGGGAGRDGTSGGAGLQSGCIGPGLD